MSFEDSLISLGIKDTATIAAFKAYGKGNLDSTLTALKLHLSTATGDPETVALDWLDTLTKEQKSSESESVVVGGTDINANDLAAKGLDVPEPINAIVKVLALKLQPSYRDGNGAPLKDDEINIGRSHFEIKGLATNGTITSFICAIRQMTHNLNMPLALSGIRKRNDEGIEKLIADVKERIMGKFIIVEYNRLEKGRTYRYADDSDPSKYRTTTPRVSANHVVSIALDESGEYNTRHEDARENNKARDAASVKVDTAQLFISQMLEAHEKGLKFEAVDMMKTMITSL